MLNPAPLIKSATLFSVVFALSKGLLYTIGITGSGNKQVPTGLKVSLWLIILLLLSPNISSYGLIYLVIPYLYLIHHKARIDIPASIILFATSIYRQSWFEDLPLLFQFGKLIGVGFFLIYFLYRTGMFKHLLDKWTIVIFAALTLVFILLAGKWDTELVGNYALPNTPKALLHHFDITENGKVQMINHTIGGYDTMEQSLPLLNTVQSIRRISADELGGLDQKFSESVAIGKPIILADGNIYYMTDKQRAPGFYTIKQVPIKQISED